MAASLASSPLAPALGRVVVVPGVYAPQSDTLMLASALRREGLVPGMDVLEVCAGSGALAVLAARLGATATAVDVGRRAVLSARINALLARRRVTVRRGDLFAAVPDRSYDVVFCNPPYVPAPGESPPRRGAARAWDAGRDGRAVVDRICAEAPGRLRPHGVLLMVHSGLCAAEETLLRLERAGLRAEVVDRARIPFGPVLRGRLPWLRRHGLVQPGEDTEELVVIRGEKR
ncbi:HemK2/MTQ2 family protein methyltransferase [Streptomyces triticirhizae]|uniref:Methyltransferase domain-containing protein n=1 Tax=Streptomyces triticirhizae TaxID=2483353 RepID=A0A3M2M9Y6_9ACTN|nr:HemK2/MTQ2 family protein methyltransferase [Streptomyces triticirhizae]RMI45415.1 methyltransferase domain-containing protein [Streptomyces triticirhizae]